MAALSSACLWVVGAVVVGALANQLPLAWLNAPLGAAPPQKVKQWLGIYEQRLGIRSWKRWIPDAGHALPGGIRKASLARRDPAALLRLVAETRRAEWVHGLLWPLWLLTLLWLPAGGVLINLLFATVFNLPCLLLQRYNRLRLRLLLARTPALLSAPTSRLPG